jgi:two-component system, sensor histidine kinase and response regulator
MNFSNSKQEILIVDDVQKNIQYIGSILAEKGYGLLIATDGVMALNTIEKRKPDLILLDINMPKMDGFETISKLKQSPIYSDIPVIFLTARNQMDDLVKAFELGAVDYISKPFQPAELLARVRTHLELKAKEKVLEEKSETIRELLRMLLHDISNPLTGLKGVIDICMEDPSFFEESKDLLNASLSGCFDIIRSVREMYSLEDGKKILEIKSVDLENVLKRVLLILHNVLKEKNIKVTCKLAKNSIFLADEASFSNSVFSNLLTNAIKFSNPNSEIIIESQKIDKVIIISIQDYGIGIPPRILENLFNFQAPTSRLGTMGEKGTGYGMPLVKKLIEAYGGKIAIESYEDGRGTKVFVTLKAVFE